MPDVIFLDSKFYEGPFVDALQDRLGLDVHHVNSIDRAQNLLENSYKVMIADPLEFGKYPGWRSVLLPLLNQAGKQGTYRIIGTTADATTLEEV